MLDFHYNRLKTGYKRMKEIKYLVLILSRKLLILMLYLLLLDWCTQRTLLTVTVPLMCPLCQVEREMPPNVGGNSASHVVFLFYFLNKNRENNGKKKRYVIRVAFSFSMEFVMISSFYISQMTTDFLSCLS